MHTSEADRLEREVTLSERGHAARTDRHAGYVRIQENSAGYRALVQVGDIVCCVFVTARPVKCSASPASFFCSSSSTLRSVPCFFFYFRALERRSFSLCFFLLSLSFSSFSRAYRQSREYISASLEIVATTTAATTPSTITTTTTTNANSERVSVPDVSVSCLPLSFFFSFYRVGAA